MVLLTNRLFNVYMAEVFSVDLLLKVFPNHFIFFAFFSFGHFFILFFLAVFVLNKSSYLMLNIKVSNVRESVTHC